VTDPDGTLVCRIVLERRTVGTRDRLCATYETPDGGRPHLVEVLTLLKFGKRRAIREARRKLDAGSPGVVDDGL
jgi:hypothetical protein